MSYKVGMGYGPERFRMGSFQIGDDAREVDAMLSGGTYMVGRHHRRYRPEYQAFHPMRRPGYGRMIGYAEIGDDSDADAPDPNDPSIQDAQQAAYADALSRTHTLVRDREPTKSRMYAIGIGTGGGDPNVVGIPDGATATLSIQPQVLFRPERIVVDGTNASNFLILDFKVGKNSQFAAQSPLPASAFAPNSFGVRLKCDTCQISAQLVLQVQNISGTGFPSLFNACIFGEAVE